MDDDSNNSSCSFESSNSSSQTSKFARYLCALALTTTALHYAVISIPSMFGGHHLHSTVNFHHLRRLNGHDRYKEARQRQQQQQQQQQQQERLTNMGDVTPPGLLKDSSVLVEELSPCQCSCIMEPAEGSGGVAMILLDPEVLVITHGHSRVCVSPEESQQMLLSHAAQCNDEICANENRGSNDEGKSQDEEDDKGRNKEDV